MNEGPCILRPNRQGVGGREFLQWAHTERTKDYSVTDLNGDKETYDIQ